MDFLAPTVVSQDLLLIQDLIGVPHPLPQKPVPKFEDDIDSSGSENGSEDEIEADLVKVENEEKKLQTNSSAPTDSTSGSDSDSDSDSSDSEDEEPSKLNIKELDVDDDEEPGVAVPTTTYFQTKNELVETDIVVPDIEEVGPDEVLERVGEIMSIMDKTVIVKGAPSGVFARASDQALDSDTLLVFEDRKVLGYIYETFGPTSQPLYQVKFSASYPVDQDKVQLSRPVFHVPQRSRFVFVNQIRRFKGSDASNMHDEEPADDELEFSDDEAEAAYKSSLKRKRESRVNSRQSTPALMRDQDLATLERNPYDDHSPYDDNFGSGPSRPAPMPYDDPYADEYTTIPSTEVESQPFPPPPSHRENSSDDSDGFARRGRGRGRGRGSGLDRNEGRFDRNEGRGRGRGRERGKGGRGRGDNDRRRSDGANWEGRPAISPRGPEPYDSHHQQQPPRSLSPTSMAIARATGQFPDGSGFTQSHSAPSTPTSSPWAFDPSQQFNYGGYPQFIQPHINPRFASAFGMNFDFQNPHPQSYYQPPPPGGSSWADEWTVHGGGNDASNGGPQ
ncbi:Gar1/Naf1 RNA binding region-domain-containing protein [Mycena alexandri]|uniref:H/ACA ribonucleoprotein complex non-core subunit NAF1 n=1 Tax=Mycena alexandri TaxID=1745969 RepID=A0AAD6XCK4_9AGAR|nr:Gar1/Naf1 RNA binding region-domain-containing protein [Mycena alexandri]